MPEGGGDRYEGIAQGVAKDGGAEGHALGDGGAHIVGGEVVHEVVFHEHGGEGEASHEVGDKGQGGVAKQVPRLGEKPELGKVVPHKTAQGKPAEFYREEQQEQAAKSVTGHRVPEKNQDGSRIIHGTAVAQGLHDTEGKTDGVSEESGNEAEVD